MSRILKITAFAWIGCCAMAAQDRERMLATMDRNAAVFRSVSATLEKISHTAVIHDDTTERGTARMLRIGKQLRVLIEFTDPDARAVVLSGRKAQIFYPKIKTVHEYDLGKHSSLLDQFLLLGFGTSGKDLLKSYSIRMLADETIAGEKTWHAELTPKSSKAREHLTKVELWISQSGGYPVRQKFFQPSGDYTTINYSKLVLNSGVDEKSVQLKLPPGTKREFPQR